MNGIHFRQQVSVVRCAPGAPQEQAAFGVLVESARAGIQATLAPSQAAELTDLEVAATNEQEEYLPRLPAAIRPGLVTEAGYLEQTVIRGGAAIAARSVRYAMATCRGDIMSFRVTTQNGTLPRSAPPWTGIIDGNDLPMDLSMVLAPAAVLALVLHLEASGSPYSRRHALRGPDNSGIVIRDITSPYPPHTSPLDLPVKLPLTELGLPDDLTPMKALFRPERWSRPIESLQEDVTSSILVNYDLTAAEPERAVIIEELTPVTSQTGRGRWLARAALGGPDRNRRAVLADLPLKLDPLDVLQMVHGRLSGLRIGVVQDGLAGERYGFAPAVLTAGTIRDLRGLRHAKVHLSRPGRRVQCRSRDL